MRRPICLSLGLTVLIYATMAHAQPPTATKPAPAATKAPAKPPENPELEAVRKSSLAFVEAFNRGDAKAVGELWTKEGEYSSETGQLSVGRAQIQEEYAEFFKANPKLKIKVEIDSLRLLSESTAIEDGRSFLVPTPPGAAPFSRYTAVHVKEGGVWRMASVRDLPVAIPVARRQLADLDWLVGKWIAEEHGSSSESVFEWTANKSFLKRTYTVKHPDKSVTSGLQIIGYSPATGQIQSWSFGSDGSIAIGIWTAESQGWAAAVRGITIDGTPTFAVNILNRIDDNAQSWRSIGRRVGDIPLPDTDEVILKRQP